MNYLLSDGDSIPLNPNLAKKIGVNHALVLQQLHFLLTVTRKQRRQYNYVEDRWWVYNTYPEWQRDYFKWLSASAIKGIFRDLEDAQLVMSKQSVKSKFDRRKWYSINYDTFEDLASSIRQNLSDENGQILSDENGQILSDVYTETTTETTSEEIPPTPLEDDAITVWTSCFGDKGAVSGRVINELVDLVKEYGNQTVVDAIRSEKRRVASGSIHVETIRRRLQYKPYTDAILKAFGSNPNDLTGVAFDTVAKTAEQLKAGGYTSEDIPHIYAWCKSQGWPSFGEAALAKYAHKWKASKRPTRPAPAPEAMAPSPGALSAANYMVFENSDGTGRRLGWYNDLKERGALPAYITEREAEREVQS